MRIWRRVYLERDRQLDTSLSIEGEECLLERDLKEEDQGTVYADAEYQKRMMMMKMRKMRKMKKKMRYDLNDS